MNIDKEVLDAPAFGAGSASTSDTTDEISQIKELGQDSELVTHNEESEEEQKIPYSRFKTIADQKRQAEDEALEMREKYERLVNERSRPVEAERPVDETILDSFIKMYGDNDNTRKAAQIETDRLSYIERRARDSAEEAYENVRVNETRSLARNEQTIDNHLDDLQSYLGRHLTDDEQTGVLEIVDEYTPKDGDGNYSGDLLPFDKAMEIYEMKNQAQGQSSKRARSNATRLTGGSSEGEPSGVEKRNKEFNPMDWNSYRNRI